MNRKPSAKKIEERKAKAEALQASITEQVEALRDSAEWVKMLDFMTKFHAYSAKNMILILSQYPDATQVAGFRKWQELGRQVRKGEKSLKIFGYREIKRTEEDATTGEEKEIKKAIFPMVSVFDISQTDPVDAEAPNYSTPAQKLAGDFDGNAAAVTEQVTAFLTGKGWNVTHEPITGAANGYTTTDGTRRVVIEEALEPAQAAKTILHEAGHVLLHSEQSGEEYAAHRGIWETEAESVAYVTAGMFGLDTSGYSIGYVAHWSEGDTEMIEATAANVLRAAHTIADALTMEAMD